MDRIRHWRLIACITVVTTLGAWGCTSNAERPPLAAAQQSEGEVPQFEWDPTWPKQPFPNNWILGMVIGLAVDPDDHVWISHRPRSVTPFEGAAGADPPTALCCVPAPPVIEFDPEGNIVQAWGGPGSGYEWPAGEHGLRIDHDRNVWIGGAEGPDAQFPQVHAGRVVFVADRELWAEPG